MQLISGNFAWALSDRVVRFLVGTALTLWMARQLGPESFGALSLAMAIVTICTIVANPGLDSIVVRDLVGRPNQESLTLCSALLIRVIGSAMATVCTFLVALTMQSQSSEVLLLTVILAFGFFAQSFDVYELWFQSKLQTKYVVIAKSIPFLSGVTARVALLAADAPVVAFAAVQTAELACAAACLFAAFRKCHDARAVFEYSSVRMRELLRAAWPLALAGGAVALYMRFDQLLLAQFFDQRTVGLYNAAVRLSEMWYLAPMVLMSTLLPVMVRLRQTSKSEYFQMLRKLYCLAVYVGLVGALGFTFLAGSLVPLLLGDEFQGSVVPLRILSWSAIPILVGVATSQYLVSENLQRISLYRTLLGLASSLPLNFVLIPLFGTRGAAMAAVVGYVVPILALTLFSRTRAQLTLLVSALNPLVLLPERRRSPQPSLG